MIGAIFSAVWERMPRWARVAYCLAGIVLWSWARERRAKESEPWR